MGDEGGTVLSWSPRKHQRRLRCDVKVKLIKLEGGSAAFQLKISIFYVYNTGSLLLSSLKKVTSPLSPRTPVLHHPFPAHRYFS